MLQLRKSSLLILQSLVKVVQCRLLNKFLRCSAKINILQKIKGRHVMNHMLVRLIIHQIMGVKKERIILITK